MAINISKGRLPTAADGNQQAQTCMPIPAAGGRPWRSTGCMSLSAGRRCCGLAASGLSPALDGSPFSLKEPFMAPFRVVMVHQGCLGQLSLQPRSPGAIPGAAAPTGSPPSHSAKCPRSESIFCSRGYARGQLSAWPAATPGNYSRKAPCLLLPSYLLRFYINAAFSVHGGTRAQRDASPQRLGHGRTTAMLGVGHGGDTCLPP